MDHHTWIISGGSNQQWHLFYQYTTAQILNWFSVSSSQYTKCKLGTNYTQSSHKWRHKVNRIDADYSTDVKNVQGENTLKYAKSGQNKMRSNARIKYVNNYIYRTVPCTIIYM